VAAGIGRNVEDGAMTDLLRRAWDALDAFKQAYPENWHDEDEQVLKDLMSADFAAPQPEPVAFFNPQTSKFRWAKPTLCDAPVTIAVPELPLYTSPPQRQPLSDEEIEELERWVEFKETGKPERIALTLLVRRVEAMHGIGGDK
jgi:hypothetical protein